MNQNATKSLPIKTILYRGVKNGLNKTLEPRNLHIQEKGMLTALVCNAEGYSCPRCSNNFGYLWMENDSYLFFCGSPECLKDDSEASKELLRAKGLAQAENIKNKDASQIYHLGSRYSGASLSKWSASEYHQKQILNWIQNPKNFLIMLGTPGTGKTYFCMAIANYLLNQNKPVKYTTIRRFFQDIQRNIENGKSQYHAIEREANYDFLIFDDLGASTNNEWQKEVLLDLIDRRYSDQKPTIFTSNFSWIEMKSILGDRIERRLNNEDNLKIVVG